MKLITVFIILFGILLVSGCSSSTDPQYDGSSYKQIKHDDFGRVVAKRGVVISDDGTGSFFGTIIGAVVGSTLGGNAGSILMSLGGGIVGHEAGKEIGKTDGYELTVELINGSTIIIVIKDETILVGDDIRIIKENNKVVQVDKIKDEEIQ